MRKLLRTYLPFVANEVKTQLAYRGAFYLWAFISLFSSFISYFLWTTKFLTRSAKWT